MALNDVLKGMSEEKIKKIEDLLKNFRIFKNREKLYIIQRLNEENKWENIYLSSFDKKIKKGDYLFTSEEEAKVHIKKIISSLYEFNNETEEFIYLTLNDLI